MSDRDELLALRRLAELEDRAAAAQLQREQTSRDAAQQTLAEMGWGERALANVGAGFSNFGQGVRQLASKVGIGAGPSDDELRDQRLRNEELRAAMTGGGALQVVGEVAPTIPLAMLSGGALGAAASRVPALAPAAAAAARLPNAARLAGTGAAGGAAGGALAPVTSDESRGENIAHGAVAGAVLNPVLGTVVPAALRAGGNVVRSIRDTLSPEGAAQRTLREAIPAAERDALAQSLRAASPSPSAQAPVGRAPLSFGGTIPETAAQRTGDATLARLEAAARANPATADDFVAFDKARNLAVFDELQSMTPSALRLQRQELARDLATAPLRDRSLSLVDKAGKPGQALLDQIDTIMDSPSGVNPAVRQVASYVRDVIAPDSSAAHVYEVRKVLAAKLGGKSMMGDDLAAAAKGARREVTNLIGAIDQDFSAKSGGAWADYLGEYGRRSQPVSNTRAMQGVMDDLDQKALMGNAPQVTAAGLQRALDANAQGRFGSKLTPEAQAQADALMATLRRGEMPGRVRKISGTMGGGSNSAMDLAQMAVGHVPVLGGLAQSAIRGTRQDITEATARAMGDALQDPEAAARLIASLPPGPAAQFLQRFGRVPAVQAGAEALMRSVRPAFVTATGQQQGNQ